MTYKILTGEEKHGLLCMLQDEIKKVECEEVKDIYSIMLALLYENIILEYKATLAECSSIVCDTSDIKYKVNEVIAQFEEFTVPPVITQEYVTGFTNMSDKLSMLSAAVAQLKVLLSQAAASSNAGAPPDGAAFQ